MNYHLKVILTYSLASTLHRTAWTVHWIPSGRQWSRQRSPWRTPWCEEWGTHRLRPWTRAGPCGPWRSPHGRGILAWNLENFNGLPFLVLSGKGENEKGIFQSEWERFFQYDPLWKTEEFMGKYLAHYYILLTTVSDTKPENQNLLAVLSVNWGV